MKNRKIHENSEKWKNSKIEKLGLCVALHCRFTAFNIQHSEMLIRHHLDPMNVLRHYWLEMLCSVLTGVIAFFIVSPSYGNVAYLALPFAPMAVLGTVFTF